MLASAALSLFGLGFLIWVLFSLAVHALPFFVAVTVGRAALGSGAGPVGAVVVALVAGAITLVLGQVAFATLRAPALRLVLGGLYALPAGVAGFGAVRALSELGGAVAPWTVIFAGIGAVAVSIAAWARVAALAGADETPVPPVATPGRGGSNDVWSTRPAPPPMRPATIRR